jgi:LacI family transcriptional regulator
MNDIAARAGVSQATVSFVLNNRRDGVSIPAETRQRVMDIARELGYRRNLLAHAMVTGQRRALGVLTAPNIGGNIVQVLVGALEAANKDDYLIKVLHLSDSQVDDSTVNRCLEWRLAGAIVVGLGEESSDFLYKEFHRAEIPVAFVENAPPREWGVLVHSDDAQGIRQAVTHLVELGHRKIAFLGGRSSMVSHRREHFFRQMMQEAQVTVHESWVRHTSWSDAAVMEEGARAILAQPDRPTAVVCAADSVAMIVLRVARSLGIRLPDELSVTGYSNVGLSGFSDPPLTTVDQSFQQMGYAAASYLIRRAGDPEREGTHESLPEVLIPTQLTVRGSTAKHTTLDMRGIESRGS